MTRSRALFIKLLELYGIPGYELSKLEIQKLAYFLQEAGEPLKNLPQKLRESMFIYSSLAVIQAYGKVSFFIQ